MGLWEEGRQKWGKFIGSYRSLWDPSVLWYNRCRCYKWWMAVEPRIQTAHVDMTHVSWGPANIRCCYVRSVRALISSLCVLVKSGKLLVDYYFFCWAMICVIEWEVFHLHWLPNPSGAGQMLSKARDLFSLWYKLVLLLPVSSKLIIVANSYKCPP